MMGAVAVAAVAVRVAVLSSPWREALEWEPYLVAPLHSRESVVEALHCVQFSPSSCSNKPPGPKLRR